MSNYINYRTEIEKDLLELDIKFNASLINEWVQHSTDSLRLDLVIAKLQLHRNAEQKANISKATVENVLMTIESDYKLNLLKTFTDKIAYQPSEADKFQELLNLICGEQHDAVYPIILRHVIWTMKRRIRGLSDYCPIFLSVYGPAGCGKSEFLKAFFSILPASLKTRVSNANDLFNDERHAFRFVENAVIIMDELTGISKTDLNKLKNQIDCEKIVYRILGLNKTSEGRNFAQLVGTSNTRLRNTITADTDIRKWAEIDMLAYSDEEIPTKMIQPLREFDWLTLWRSVDENGPSPFHDANVYSQFKKWTFAKCQHESAHSLYLEEIKDRHAGEWLSKAEIYDKGYLIKVEDHQLNWGNFREKAEKMGFVFRKRNAGAGLIVPSKAKGEPDVIFDINNL